MLGSRDKVDAELFCKKVINTVNMLKFPRQLMHLQRQVEDLRAKT